MLPSILVLIYHFGKPRKNVYLQQFFPSIDLGLVYAELLVLMSEGIALVIPDVFSTILCRTGSIGHTGLDPWVRNKLD